MQRFRHASVIILLTLLGLIASPLSTTALAEDPPQASSWTGTLRPGEVLRDRAAGGNILVHQTDGNVVVYNVDRKPIWNTRTNGKSTSRLVAQGDGNLVLYDTANRPIWHTKTNGTGATLSLQGDANLVLYDANQRVRWAAKHWPPKPAAPAPGTGVPFQLRKIGWCEAGAYMGLPKYQTNYRAYNQQGSSASGGYQILDSTWRTWRTYVATSPPATNYARAAHAPAHVQDQIATAAYHRHGSSPWNPSRYCWG